MRYHGRRRRRRGARRHRKSTHRYPHKTHPRRATEHSFADQGPTHFGQQHPFHPLHGYNTRPDQTRPEIGDQDQVDQAETKQKKRQHPTRRSRRLDKQRRKRHFEFNSEEGDSSSFTSSSSDGDYSSESSYDESEDEYDEPQRTAHRDKASHYRGHYRQNDLGVN